MRSRAVRAPLRKRRDVGEEQDERPRTWTVNAASPCIRCTHTACWWQSITHKTACKQQREPLAPSGWTTTWRRHVTIATTTLAHGHASPAPPAHPRPGALLHTSSGRPAPSRPHAAAAAPLPQGPAFPGPTPPPPRGDQAAQHPRPRGLRPWTPGGEPVGRQLALLLWQGNAPSRRVCAPPARRP